MKFGNISTQIEINHNQIKKMLTRRITNICKLNDSIIFVILNSYYAHIDIICAVAAKSHYLTCYPYHTNNSVPHLNFKTV